MSRRTRSRQIDTSGDFFVDRLFVSDLPQPEAAAQFCGLCRWCASKVMAPTALQCAPGRNGAGFQAAVSCVTVCCATVSCGMLPGVPGDGSRII
jgi:hypothetical protein